jgi:thiamine phosphate synthase YjbQ (UPF0047 family)
VYAFIQYTSASLVIQANADPTCRDLEAWLNLAWKTILYTHTVRSDDMPAHIKEF